MNTRDVHHTVFGFLCFFGIGCIIVGGIWAVSVAVYTHWDAIAAWPPYAAVAVFGAVLLGVSLVIGLMTDPDAA